MYHTTWDIHQAMQLDLIHPTSNRSTYITSQKYLSIHSPTLSTLPYTILYEHLLLLPPYTDLTWVPWYSIQRSVIPKGSMSQYQPPSTLPLPLAAANLPLSMDLKNTDGTLPYGQLYVVKLLFVPKYPQGT